MLDALLKSHKILRGKIIQRENSNMKQAKQSKGEFCRWIQFLQCRCTVYRVCLMKANFQMSHLWVEPVFLYPETGNTVKHFGKQTVDNNGISIIKWLYKFLTMESYSIVNSVKLDLPLCTPCKVLHMLWLTMISHLYYVESGVILHSISVNWCWVH